MTEKAISGLQNSPMQLKTVCCGRSHTGRSVIVFKMARSGQHDLLHLTTVTMRHETLTSLLVIFAPSLVNCDAATSTSYTSRQTMVKNEFFTTNTSV